jgi:hypothetical protein
MRSATMEASSTMMALAPVGRTPSAPRRLKWTSPSSSSNAA